METLDEELQRIAKLSSWSDADAARVVGAWRESGETRAVFGRRYGIHVHRLYYWIAAAEKRNKVSAGQKRVKFHPVQVVPEGKRESSAPIEIHSIRVPRGFDPVELRAVISALSAHG
jgi:transposase-like protein